MEQTKSELQTTYLANSNICPFCHSSDIDGGSTLEVDNTGAWQEITCPQCGARWNDNYSLTGIEILDDPRPKRYQFQTWGGAIGNDIDISFENIDSFAGLNTEHSFKEIAGLEIAHSLPYSTGVLVRLEDATDQATNATPLGQDTIAVAMADSPADENQVVTGTSHGDLWYDYTNRAYVKNGVYITCGHDKREACCKNQAMCYGRLHAGETPAQNIIEQYANAQNQQEAKAEIRSEIAAPAVEAPAVEAPPLRSLSEVLRRGPDLRQYARQGGDDDPYDIIGTGIVRNAEPESRFDSVASIERGVRIHKEIQGRIDAGEDVEAAITEVMTRELPRTSDHLETLRGQAFVSIQPKQRRNP